MRPFEFTHQIFYASTWEQQVKEFIGSLDCSDNILWFKKREYKKINEELVSLGYYAQYRYGVNKDVTFRLNEKEENEYQEYLPVLVDVIESKLQNSCFKQIALVDADFVGVGDVLLVPNKSAMQTLELSLQKTDTSVEV